MKVLLFYLDDLMSYSVYILRMKDGRYYVGMTSDLPVVQQSMV
jgi:hypothetical protein